MKNQWVKIGEVEKYHPFPLFKSSYSLYAVFEMITDTGMRKYKEVYMASGTYGKPILKSAE